MTSTPFLIQPAALWALLGIGAACGVSKHPYQYGAVSGSGGTAAGVDASSGTGLAGSGGAAGSGGPATGGIGGGSDAGGAGDTGAPVVRDAGGPGDSAPAPPSGASVTIAGRVIAKEKAVVFLHLGHSDMAGRAQGPAAERPYFYDTDPHLYTYRRGGIWTPAKEPTAGDGLSGQGAGPGMALLRAALTYAPDSTFISIGLGKSGSQEGWCPNFRKRANLMYPILMASAMELKGKVTFAGLFTMLGITEYHGGSTGLNSFGDCLIGLADEIRADLGEPNLPLMVGGWNQGGTGIYSPTGQYGRICVPQMLMVPTRDARAAVIPTDGLPMNDDRHLNMMGHRIWAERGLKIMSDKGWLPWMQD